MWQSGPYVNRISRVRTHPRQKCFIKLFHYYNNNTKCFNIPVFINFVGEKGHIRISSIQDLLIYTALQRWVLFNRLTTEMYDKYLANTSRNKGRFLNRFLNIISLIQRPVYSEMHQRLILNQLKQQFLPEVLLGLFKYLLQCGSL